MNRRTTTKLPEAITAFIAITWLGMLLGVSFIATPVKFQAPSLSLPVALEIGRVTFSLFSKIEWATAALLILSGLACKRRILSLLFCAGLAAILTAETSWLLPILDIRVEAIISGTPTPADWHHFLYVGLEMIKATLLIALSIHLLRQLTAAHESPDIPYGETVP
ncbi:protein of unknown function (DUF4149) [Hoeflea sp. IMCC20628]|uniref:DUF4149 domain-containing protein n=1 Tax=Hoeflea sp. IMCC20628 TaxID=1620421 RepID=UPI00063AB559|nr:DUF4149 domain-containing protein [Hoeflea sp. IMCC20628]AKH98804.1 protein of unknown function (DUF4149) [Hoeflea sp. IMCC20628]